MVVTSRLGAIKREAENFIIYIFHNIQMVSIIIISAILFRSQHIFTDELTGRVRCNGNHHP